MFDILLHFNDQTSYFLSYSFFSLINYFTGVPGEAMDVKCEKDVFDIIGKEYVEPKDRNV